MLNIDIYVAFKIDGARLFKNAYLNVLWSYITFFKKNIEITNPMHIATRIIIMKLVIKILRNLIIDGYTIIFSLSFVIDL